MTDVSHPDRVIFPDVGLTKADVVRHYERVGPSMLRFLANRPLTLQRFPKGLEAKGFMQKNAGKHFPDSIGRYAVPKRDGEVTNYPVVTIAADLAYLANQGTLTFHMWTATIDRPHHPDWMVLDLDPEADDIDGVRFAVQAVRELLTEFELDGFALATGSKGFHIWVPLDGSLSFGEVSRVTRAIAGLAVARYPDRLTIEFLKKKRKGRVFVDWLRNTGVATVVVPFSLRPRPTAPVAVPLRWDELAATSPSQWTLTDFAEGAEGSGHVDVRDRLDIAFAIAPQVLPSEAIVATAQSANVDIDTPHDRFGR